MIVCPPDSGCEICNSHRLASLRSRTVWQGIAACAALVVFLLLALAAVAHAQLAKVDTVTIHDTIHDTIHVYEPPVNALAVTYCRNGGKGGETWYREDALDSKRLPEIRVHEAKHREQGKRYANCDVWAKIQMENPHSLLDTEVEAFCASAPIAVAAGWDRADVFSDYVNRLYNYFGGKFQVYDISQTFRKDCP